jgi:hypothetical protein
VGIEHHVKKAGFRIGRQTGKAGERIRQNSVLVDDAEGAGQSFGDENLFVGKNGKRPGGMQCTGQSRNGEGRGGVVRGSRLFREERLIVTFFRRPGIDRLAFYRGVDRVDEWWPAGRRRRRGLAGT